MGHNRSVLGEEYRLIRLVSVVLSYAGFNTTAHLILDLPEV
jgi:hypothetical protein